MKVLILGSGGREHAFAWHIAQDPAVSHIYVAPGNAGTANEPKVHNVALDILNNQQLIHFALEQQIDFTLVGPEAPLVQGIVDDFKHHGLAIFGPSAAAAQLEGSKAFTKDFLARHHIPTAHYQTFTEAPAACHYLQQQTFPIVIKADGLAAGKGVIIAESYQQAAATVDDMLSGNTFGEAGHRVVIEEFLQGEEASFIVMVDGTHVLPLATSQDHKRIGRGDTGPNTGGMGAYSPAPVVTPVIHTRIMEEIILPTVAGMAQEGHPYVGFLYAGLMIDNQGQAKVIEYNCRFGDPETQPVLMRLNSSLIDLCQAAIRGELDQTQALWDERSAVGVVMAADGYPGDYSKGHLITLPNTAVANACKIFHAGTALKDGQLVTAGGRVLCVTALGETVTEAQQTAYESVKQTHWQGAYYRDDIAYRAIEREHCE